MVKLNDQLPKNCYFTTLSFMIRTFCDKLPCCPWEKRREREKVNGNINRENDIKKEREQNRETHRQT